MRKSQLAGETELDLYHPDPNKRPCFFQCINPARFDPNEYDFPACLKTHFADWNEVIECSCGFLYKWKNQGLYRIMERPKQEETSWDMDADEYFDDF